MYSIKLELLKVPCAFIKWQNAPSRTSVLATVCDYFRNYQPEKFHKKVLTNM